MARNLVFDTFKHARKTDPSTSKSAANRADIAGQAKDVLLGLKAATSGRTVGTSAELASMMGVDRYLTARRLPDLAGKGLAHRCGKAVCTINNTQAVTWRC